MKLRVLAVFAITLGSLSLRLNAYASIENPEHPLISHPIILDENGDPFLVLYDIIVPLQFMQYAYEEPPFLWVHPGIDFAPKRTKFCQPNPPIAGCICTGVDNSVCEPLCVDVDLPPVGIEQLGFLELKLTSGTYIHWDLQYCHMLPFVGYMENLKNRPDDWVMAAIEHDSYNWHPKCCCHLHLNIQDPQGYAYNPLMCDGGIQNRLLVTSDHETMEPVYFETGPFIKVDGYYKVPVADHLAYLFENNPPYRLEPLDFLGREIEDTAFEAYKIRSDQLSVFDYEDIFYWPSSGPNIDPRYHLYDWV